LVTFAEVQAFASHLESLELAASSRRSIISAVKSLLSFGNKIGVFSVNVGAPLKPPSAPDTLSERILSESQVQVMIALEQNPRNRAILRLLYYGGLRVSELCSLKWRNLQSRGAIGQVTVYGKGDKTRVVVLPGELWSQLLQLRSGAGEDEPVFASRKRERGGHMHRYSVDRIVKAAAKRAGIQGNVSPHWLRHAHASHALERGAKIHLVQATLGHSSVAVTSRYLHARPEESSGLYLPK
jgi:integrase/recombinase XerD